MKKTITLSKMFDAKQHDKAFLKLIMFVVFLFGIQNFYAQTNTWDGSSSNSWNTSANWSLNHVPTSSEDVVIPNVSTDPRYSSSSSTVKSITVQNGGNLLFERSSAYTLTVTGNVTVNLGGSFGVRTGGSAATSTLTVGGSFVNDGSVDFVDESVINLNFNGSSAQTISGSGSAMNLNAITLTNASTFAVNRAINLDSNWTNNGKSVSGSGTVTLNGTATIGGSTSTSFPNLTITGTVTQGISTSVSGNFSQTGGTYNQNAGATAYSLTVTGNFSLSGSSVFNMQTTSNGLGATTTVNGATGTTISGTARLNMDDGGATASNVSIFQTTNFSASSTGIIIDFGDEGNTKNNQFRISGNCSKTGTSGRFYTSATPVNGGLVFNGTGATQTVSIVASSNTEYYNVTVNANALVQLTSALTLGTASNPASSLIVNGTLDTQAFSPAILGGNSGTFSLASGATLITGNVNGIVSGTTGTVSTSVGTRTFNATANYIFDGAANQTANLVNTTLNDLTIANTSGTVTLNTALTVNNVTINSGGGSLTAGSVTHLVSGNWTNNGGTFVPGTGTIAMNGTLQTIGGTSSSINFNNLSLSGGTKTFNKSTAIGGNLSIASGALANFGSLTTNTSSTLTLGSAGTAAAKFGSTSTSATAPVFKNNTYFTSGTTGYITVATSSCTAPTMTLGAIVSICQNALAYSIPYSALTGSADLYSISGTGITAVTYGNLGAAPSTITVNLSSPAVAGTITPSVFTVTNSLTGCTSSNLNGSVNVIPTVGTPSFTVGALTICQDAANETYTATATNSTGITYSVSPVGAGTIGSSTGIMNWDANFSGTATITASAAGCNGPKTLDRVVTITPSVGTPSFILGATTICQDAPDTTYTATAANSSGITYSVSPVGAGTIGSSTGIMNWDANFSGTATITASSAGCNGPLTQNRVVLVNPFPVVTASDVSGCSGSSIALLGSGTPLGGTGNYSVANPFIGSSSTTYTYSYTDPNGCSATSLPANITITAQPLWYLDADNDQYYSGVAIPSCTSPGEGYTTDILFGGGDCTDNDPAINPSVTDICYNGIDENCDTVLSDGCAPVVVNMTSSYDNSTLASLSLAIPAVGYSYPGTTNIKYRFSVSNLTTGITAPDVIQTSRYITIPGVIHSYNAAYSIKVAAVINDEIVPFAGNTITVNSPTVQLISLNSVSCGSTLATLTSTIMANPGLNATGYTFRIRLNDSNPSPTYGYSPSASRFVGANSFTGFPLQFQTSYKIAVQYSFIDPITSLTVESGYGAECVVNTPSIPIIGLASPGNNAQVATMNANISATSASYATSYQFRIRLFTDNGPTPTYYYSIPNASRFSSLTAFQGISFAYNTNYSISVQYSVFDGVSTLWSGYGPETKIKTPFFPVTSLIPTQCGSMSPTSLTQQLNISPYPGFPNYRVLLEEISGEDVVNSEEREISYSYFKLSDFSIAQLGKNYNISVAIKLNGVFGDYDSACDVFTEAPSKTAMPLAFNANAYPNPFANNFMLDVKTSSQSDVNLKVYDMIGRLIEQKDVSISDMENTMLGNGYPSGVYNIIVSQEDNVQTLRVIKR
ncbi:T9SS type A sorting domain-containing protein [Flavobacterium sp. 25HG05S-40]|uniref:T9SS type A sorting domain-containing protein n=1 Tax=Flavobacterium sp. 25HG05S-40 TaxID=3458682 RepID=UPI004043CA61